jgi:SAM-dependent methyltransferase
MTLSGTLRSRLDALLIEGLLGRTEWALRHRLGVEAGQARAPDPCWGDDANTALRSRAQVDAALEETRRCRLPQHPTPEKNWDALIALALILEQTGPGARILDAGAPLYSVNLAWLYLLGYRNLHGVDLTYDRPVRRGPIRYEPGDLTRTQFPDASFDAVTCMSVIEHGVDPEAYFREMARLIAPGGLLVTSADYWADPIDTGDRVALGVPVRIFSAADAEELVAIGERHGFRAPGPIDLSCDERVVHWDGLEYTFLALAMQRGD